MTYFPIHAHSAYSVMDGMGEPADHIKRTAELGQPGFALSDHGTMAGTVQGYQAAKKAGIRFFPASEFYLVRDVADPDTRGQRWHLSMMALNFEGLQALTRLTTLSWQADRFYRKPLIDLNDLAYLYDNNLTRHLALTTGCYSGFVIDSWDTNGPLTPQDSAHNRIRMLRTWFPHIYVELQDHGITWPDGTTDRMIASALYKSAQKLGLPVVHGQDSHYVRDHEQPVHDLMKDICYFGDGEDNHFNGGPYGLEPTEFILDRWPKHVQAEIEAGHMDLLLKHTLSIPALDTYKFQVPAMKTNPDRFLYNQTRHRLSELRLDTSPAGGAYEQRLKDELDVIRQMGMANYFLLVQEHVTRWCQDNGIIVNTRGSANGSLVCYLLGITTVDPIKWGTSFDRFLSIKRKKPPDIDVDVDFRGRERLIEHLRAVYPTMAAVGTYAKIGLGQKKRDTDEDSGSVIVQYMAAMSRKDPNFDGKVKPEHKAALYRLADTTVYKSMGKNAAGFILPAKNYPIDKYLPLGRVISSDSTVTQYGKDDVEALGYVKIDVLGLRALQTLNSTLQRIGKQPNEWDWIPLDDKKACLLMRSGRGVGLFQFEGRSTEQGGREMQVKTTHDAILALALYRPALMNGGQKDAYLANRGLKRQDQVRLHPIFDPVVDSTEGVPLFQEQIMEMLQVLGMQFEEYNALMTAIKASNGFIANAAETFKRLMPLFYDLCTEKGIDDEEADVAWNAVIGFTEYGFNRAHATSYGLMAYWSAYLKAHYPLEYLASLLDVWGDVPDKVRYYVTEARRLNITIVKADVNHSKTAWDIDPTRKNALRKGLVSLPGIKDPTADVIVAEREANGPYLSVQDFIDRTPRRPVTGGTAWKNKRELIGVCKVLMESDAFRGLPEDSTS